MFVLSSRSILYQRGIYPPESFQVQKRYGLSLMVTAEEALTKYLTDVLTQMSGGAVLSGLAQRHGLRLVHEKDQPPADPLLHLVAWCQQGGLDSERETHCHRALVSTRSSVAEYEHRGSGSHIPTANCIVLRMKPAPQA